MRKILFPIALLASVSLMAAPQSPLKIEDLKTMNFFQNKGVSILGTAMAGDLTLVSFAAQTPQGSQKMTAFVSKDKKMIIVGGGFLDQTGEQLAIPMNMSEYAKDAAFTIGHGKKEIFIFTDPECPYCKKMEQEVFSKLSPDEYTAHLFLFPLSFHQHAEAMSLWIMSQKTTDEKVKALHAVSGGSNDFETASFTEGRRIELKTLLAKQMAVAQALGVTGTPTVFDSKGTSVNWTTLGIKK